MENNDILLNKKYIVKKDRVTIMVSANVHVVDCHVIPHIKAIKPKKSGGI